jgi:hypothetical protein
LLEENAPNDSKAVRNGWPISGKLQEYNDAKTRLQIHCHASFKSNSRLHSMFDRFFLNLSSSAGTKVSSKETSSVEKFGGP